MKNKALLYGGGLLFASIVINRRVVPSTTPGTSQDLAMQGLSTIMQAAGLVILANAILKKIG